MRLLNGANPSPPTPRRIVRGVRLRGRVISSVVRWYLHGRPAPPPPSVKRAVLRRHLRAHRLKVFVETGTFLGETAAALAPMAAKVVTIELSSELVDVARRHLARAKNVSVFHGDSALLLPSVLADLHEPALFWLDGHYSEGNTARGLTDTPVREELAAILRHASGGHVILIDDARAFEGGEYPTIAEIEWIVHELAPAYCVSVRHDIIRVLPPNSPFRPVSSR
jgi:SAM-dependent methyltransferase